MMEFVNYKIVYILMPKYFEVARERLNCDQVYFPECLRSWTGMKPLYGLSG